MAKTQLTAYITEQRNLGVSDDKIKAALLDSGWQQSDIDEAFGTSTDVVTPASPLSPLSPVSNRASQLQKYKKAVYAFFIFVILVVIGGVGVFAYLSNNPEKVVEKMTERFLNVTSMEYSGKIVTTIKRFPGLDSTLPTASERAPSTFTFSGKTNLTDLTNPQGTLLLHANLGTYEETATELDLEARFLGKTVYLILNQATDFGMYSDPAFLKQWIKMDTTGMFSSYENSEQNAQPEITPEKRQKIARIIRDAHIFKVTSKLTDEVVHDVSTFHFGYEIDKQAFKNASIEITKVLATAELSEEELAGLQASHDQTLELLDFTGGEIWVGKYDLMPHKIKLNINVLDTTSKNEIAKIEYVSEMKNFNQAVTVEEPTPVKTLEELFSQASGTGYGMIGGMGRLEGDPSQLDPEEQRNLGKDMGSQADAKELLGGIYRFEGTNQYVPWNTSGGISRQLAWLKISRDNPWADGGNPNCSVLEKLSLATDPECFDANELKISFIQRIVGSEYNSLYLYNRGQEKDETHACFVPLSATFKKDASEKCKDAQGSGLSSDIESSVRTTICGGYSSSTAPIFSCVSN